METVTATPEVSTEVNMPDFGAGRYSNIARELFRDSQRVNVAKSPEQAERLAKAYVADWGRANLAVDKANISKPNKDGFVTLKEAASRKFVRMTPSMRIAKIVSVLDDARKLGVNTFISLTLDKDLRDWIEESAAAAE